MGMFGIRKECLTIGGKWQHKRYNGSFRALHICITIIKRLVGLPGSSLFKQADEQEQGNGTKIFLSRKIVTGLILGKDLITTMWRDLKI
jgi:hypothetical protein